MTSAGWNSSLRLRACDWQPGWRSVAAWRSRLCSERLKPPSVLVKADRLAVYTAGSVGWAFAGGILHCRSVAADAAWHERADGSDLQPRCGRAASGRSSERQARSVGILHLRTPAPHDVVRGGQDDVRSSRMRLRLRCKRGAKSKTECRAGALPFEVIARLHGCAAFARLTSAGCEQLVDASCPSSNRVTSAHPRSPGGGKRWPAVGQRE